MLLMLLLIKQQSPILPQDFVCTSLAKRAVVRTVKPLGTTIAMLLGFGSVRWIGTMDDGVGVLGFYACRYFEPSVEYAGGATDSLCGGGNGETGLENEVGNLTFGFVGKVEA